MDTFELLSRDDGLASVDSYGDSAFIVNGVLVSQQSLIIFGGTSLLWYDTAQGDKEHERHYIYMGIAWLQKKPDDKQDLERVTE